MAAGGNLGASRTMNQKAGKTLRPGGARIAVEWGYDVHDVLLTPRNWSRVIRGRSLTIRTPGFSEEGLQWEYWDFAGGLGGDLVVRYGDDGGEGFVGKLRDARIEVG
jgi:hypothetical protein